MELDADVTRKLLESSPSLCGTTADVWADASERHAGLWRDQFALDAALGRVAELRGAGRWAPRSTVHELSRALSGASVVAPDPARSGRRGLLELEPELATTFEGAFQRMAAEFDVVATVVATVAAVWGPVVERLDALADVLSNIAVRVERLEGQLTNELHASSEVVEAARRVARHDPLALPAETAGSSRPAWSPSTAQSTSSSGRARSGGASWTARRKPSDTGWRRPTRRAQLAQWAEKVVVPDSVEGQLDDLVLGLSGLRAQCARQRRLRRPVDTLGLRRRADALTNDVQRLAQAEAARLPRRNELRGVLDAYLAEAQATGLGEDLEVDAAYVAARDALSVAPCDLAVAEQLVSEFRHVVWRASENER